MDKDPIMFSLAALLIIAGLIGLLARARELQNDCLTKAMAAHYNVSEIQLICR